jgi:membrane dipeptidase
MAEGGLWAQFFGLVTFPLWKRGLARSCHRRIDLLEREVAANPGEIRICRSAADVRAAKAAGSRAALLGIEGAHSLEGRLENAEVFARRGVRYLGLLHFSRNEAGFPAKGYGRDDAQGLTSFGFELVEELQRLGVIVDLTHVNRKGFFDAVGRARAPMIISHTGVTGVQPHWRNADDEMLRAVARTGGVAGVIFATKFLGEDSLDAVVRHLRHIRDVAGEDVPALGSDFDGCVVPPRELPDVAALPRLTEALLRGGFSETQVLKLLGGNAMRVLEAVPPRAM